MESIHSIHLDINRYKERKPNKNLHADLHLITNEVWEYCGKDKPFSFYLGMIKRIGTERARYILANIKDRQTPATHPGKLFVWMTKNK